MKSRFIPESSIVTKLNGLIFDFFTNIYFSSQLVGLEKNNPSDYHNSIEIFVVNEQFTIFSLTYNTDVLVKGVYKWFLYPNIMLPGTEVFDNTLTINSVPYEINTEDIEVILNNDQTFNINIKMINKNIRRYI